MEKKTHIAIFDVNLSHPGSADFLIGKSKNLSEDESSHLIFQKKYVIIYM